MTESLEALKQRIRACRICADRMTPEPRPVLQASKDARLLIIGQAPGTRVHKSGKPFTDPSGDRLRDWLGIGEDVFYDADHVAITPMGFCFPGQDAKGGDLPPRKECAPEWHTAVHEKLPKVRLTLLVGLYAQKYHLGEKARPTLTETVRDWRSYDPSIMPLPHPSWRNNAWIRKNSWFESELLPELKRRVQAALHGNFS